jgi:hypothetical protein
MIVNPWLAANLVYICGTGYRNSPNYYRICTKIDFFNLKPGKHLLRVTN